MAVPTRRGDNPCPPSESDGSGFQTAQVHLPREIQEGGGTVEFQVVTPGAQDQEDQPQIVQFPSGFQTAQVHLPREIQAGGGTVEFQVVTPGAQDQEDQPQIVQLPNYSVFERPPPRYEAIASSYPTLQVDLAPSVASVPIQADDGTVEFQTVTLRAQEHVEQPQIVVIPDSSSGLNYPPPPYEAVASDSQTFQVDTPPSYDEAVHYETIM